MCCRITTCARPSRSRASRRRWPIRATRCRSAVWRLESGFEVGDLAVISEQDILGDRLVRQKRKAKRPQDFLTEVAALTPGDLVVHVDHGIGRFEGLQDHRGRGRAA